MYGIYHIYTWLCNIHGICMVYTIHIPCKIFIGVPDDYFWYFRGYHPNFQELAAANCRQAMTSGFLPHTISYVTYDIVCLVVQYRIRCWMSYTISYILYRIYDIAFMDIRYWMYNIVCLYDTSIVCQHVISYVSRRGKTDSEKAARRPPIDSSSIAC